MDAGLHTNIPWILLGELQVASAMQDNHNAKIEHDAHCE